MQSALVDQYDGMVKYNFLSKRSFYNVMIV